MFDLPDHPVIRNMERTGYPDGKEPEEPRCPVCGAICETIYTFKGADIVGCDICLTTKDEFGFEQQKIVIVHEVAKCEINRHQQLRRTGNIERLPLYAATDWNYIRFNIRGNVTMCYEMHNGELSLLCD